MIYPFFNTINMTTEQGYTEKILRQVLSAFSSVLKDKEGLQVIGNMSANVSGLSLEATQLRTVSALNYLGGAVNTNNDLDVNVTLGGTDVSVANPFPVDAVMTTAPTQFVLDGVNTQVVEDTVTPSNNTPLPVKITSTTGDINITAGDLNVQLSDVGANYDSTRIGNGTNLMAVNASLEAQVRDDDANTLLGTIDADTNTIAGDTTSIDGKITACNTGAVVISGTVTTTNESETAPSKTRITNLNNAAQTVVASAADIVGYTFINNNAYPIYIKLYNILVGGVTVGTSAVITTLSIPAHGEVILAYSGARLERYSTGITIAATKLLADSDTTVLATNVHAEIYYKA